MNDQLLPILASLLFLGSGLAVASPTAAPLSPPPTFLTELGHKVAPDLLPDLERIEAMLPQGTVGNPAQLLDRVETVRAAFAGATTPQASLAAASALAGLMPAAAGAPAKASPMQSILGLYSALGLRATPAQTLALQGSIAKLTPARSAALGVGVDAVNRALALADEGTTQAQTQAAQVLLDGAAAARILLGTPPLGASPASAGCAVFEDPLQVIWIGSPCNDTVSAFPARALQLDPGGDDTYFNNAGGAQSDSFVTGSGSLVGFNPTSERGFLEVLDNVTTKPLTPLDPTNDTWLTDVNARLGDLQDTIAANNDSVTNEIAFVGELIAGIDLHLTTNPDAMRRQVPVALAVDFAGNDLYSGVNVVQGTGRNGGVGVLWDQAGDDTYVCNMFCQGYGSQGIGVLADSAGMDHYTANLLAQGSGNGGFLLEYAGSDLYTGGIGVQAGVSDFTVPRSTPAFLVDRAGNDQYVSTGFLSQGVSNFLVDLAGDDSYTGATSSQGGGVAESIGMLLDVDGNDGYLAGADSQGMSRAGAGILADLSGDDTYTDTDQGQGVSGGGLAVLYDANGDDTYSAASGQGLSNGAGVGLVLDLSGDDTYEATGSAQGVGAPTGDGGLLGVLLDHDGNDHYTAGAHSQGSGAIGAGLLLDAYGHDVYLAGDYSQGSGGSDMGIEERLVTGLPRPHEGGIGILLDGTQDQVRVSTQVSNDPGEVTGTITVSSPPKGPPTADDYTAGDYSQGSSGPTGGIGLLLDREDKGGWTSHFIAGGHSQGSAAQLGIGVLQNSDGKDSYSAGNFSQGSSEGGVALLLDESGNDSYTSSDIGTSHGFGGGDPVNGLPALGLLLDDGGHDTHQDLANSQCKAKGDLGLAVDTTGAALPAGCDAVLKTAASDMLLRLVDQVNGTVQGGIGVLMGLLFPTGFPAPTGTIYFYDDMESGAPGWTTTTADDITVWHLADSATEPQLSPNAHSGTHYWHVGFPAGSPPTEGYFSDADASLTSPTVSLAGASAPQLKVWLAGTSEQDFDFLDVTVVDLTTSTATTYHHLSESTVTNPAPTYQQYTVDLTSYVGDDIQVVFHFTSDSSAELGQGWNVDDVLVTEA
ncbi:MAG TPA: choice-of-anchor J domain-containing protein [Candidatus Thermoplasmatota archaeon]|nr:choice-of-anchor J domain-containing protein [Candidatus Thermoplasmatota archaeon]